MPTVKEAIHNLKGVTGHVAMVYWCEEDVIERAASKGVRLGSRAAGRILDKIDRRHDCETGITWDTLDYYIEEFQREHPHYRKCETPEI